ncbi:hypothetical protein SCLCIDRAFT_288871 [Scleroderma citrinum Foug A]|uniref:tRNA-guanine(15) transglycosylase-like domain-containing protein n=1 Tax=Scleroderma citrinum Foug A TaxID=1036808 RepID=A0A0C3DHF1_9AGAM|nr:hypothetical protein SCLCIDRAFT_288871 [Scleroderma citrinum Foug A]
MGVPTLSFNLTASCLEFGPRFGQITLSRPTTVQDSGNPSFDVSPITIDTPNILVGTSRGVVPHLSRDHCNSAGAIKWINVPFESFLEQSPPIPMLQSGANPLHTFLGFDTRKHIVSFCLRDPMDTREMPPNGNTHISANCVRGVRKVTPADWRNYVYTLQPDVVFALSDTPFTAPPHSQKRATKSIERSAAWLADLLRPLDGHDSSCPSPDSERSFQHPLNVFVNMAGGTSVPAREAFAHSLSETLFGSELQAVSPLKHLDDGVAGYSFDLAALRGTIPQPLAPHRRTPPASFLEQEVPAMTLQDTKALAELPTPGSNMLQNALPASSRFSESSVPPDVVPLLQASLKGLQARKPRLVTAARSPHEILKLIRDVGVDIFDAELAISAASVGVALDFVFPLPPTEDVVVGGAEKKEVGHNLYDPVYAHQFGRLSDCLAGAAESHLSSPLLVCSCIACSPRSPASYVLHSNVDVESSTENDRSEKELYRPPHSRAYLHHLLRTHEMSAHTLLAAHNLAVLDIFLAGVRSVLVDGNRQEEGECEAKIARFALEVNRFEHAYDESMGVIAAARKDWSDVDIARGKGKLARERGKQALVEAEG